MSSSWWRDGPSAASAGERQGVQVGRARRRDRRRRAGGAAVASLHEHAARRVRHDGHDQAVRRRAHLVLVSDLLHRRTAAVHQQQCCSPSRAGVRPTSPTDSDSTPTTMLQPISCWCPTYFTDGQRQYTNNNAAAHLVLVSDLLHRRTAAVHQQRLLDLEYFLRAATGAYTGRAASSVVRKDCRRRR